MSPEERANEALRLARIEGARITGLSRQRIAAAIAAQVRAAAAEPCCCPVCGGRGLVPVGWYAGNGLYGGWSTGGANTESACHACMGSGVLWRP